MGKCRILPARSPTRSFTCRSPQTPQPTEPYFTRPTTEQPYYDISNEAWRERSFAPYPLSAWAEFTFDGVPIRLGMVVQTLARVTGVGGVYQPLVRHARYRRTRRARSPPSSARRLGPCPSASLFTPSAPPTEPSISSSPKAGAPTPRNILSSEERRRHRAPHVFGFSRRRRSRARLHHSRPSRTSMAKTTPPAGRASATPACGPTTSTSPPSCARAKSM